MEGKCDLDADGDGVTDDFEAELLWSCGWYVIRVEYGLIPETGVPEWCGLDSGPSANCYHTDFDYSFLYVGPPNTDGSGWPSAGPNIVVERAHDVRELADVPAQHT